MKNVIPPNAQIREIRLFDDIRSGVRYPVDFILDEGTLRRVWLREVAFENFVRICPTVGEWFGVELACGPYKHQTKYCFKCTVHCAKFST